MSPPFAHLHVHTQYSLLDGAIRLTVPEDVRRAGVAFRVLPDVLQEQGFAACAITDTGNLFGAIEFYKTLKKAGIKPVIGMEALIVEGRPTGGERGRAGLAELVLLCQDRQGYQNLVQLASLGYTQGRPGQPPCLEPALLEKHHAGLIALTSHRQGVLGKPLEAGDEERAREAARWYAQVFAGRLYVELQDHGLPADQRLNGQLLALAQELELPLVGSNGCRYLLPEEAYPHYILQLMGHQQKVTDRAAPPFVDGQLYLKSPHQMAEALKAYPEQAYTNAGAIAERCELDLSVHKTYLPRYEIPPDTTEEAWFRRQVHEGLERRIAQLAPAYGVPADPADAFWQPYRERLEYELGVVVSMHYAGYFLIVADFINHAKDHGVRVGPGRGSGAGSLVAYALRITDLDPIRNGLLFERFLNPDRVSLPDFDVDFAVQGREQVIQYVQAKYGADRVCQISTFGALKAKAALRGVARVLDIPYGQADRIAKLIPNKLNITLQEALQLEPELARLEREGSEQEQKLIRTSKALELLTSTLSTHAAGVIIMDTAVQDVMPVCTSSRGEGGLQTQYSMKWAEEQGAVKFDFLGLLNLDILSHAQKLIRLRPETREFDIDLVPLDDAATFRLLCRGDTTGVFQLESGGMRRLLLDLKPGTFEDIVAAVALYRPGPMQLIPQFVRRKHGREPVDYLHPKLEGLLKETYGVMVYQEQVIRAAQLLAGYTAGEADLLRRAIGKKIPAEMAQQRQRFVDGCAANGIDGAKAQEIFEKIDYFAGYGFNKSHSAAYGLIAYQTAYLKANFPVEFMTALLSSDMDNTDKVVNFIADCKEMGVQVLPPDVEASGVDFAIAGRGVRFGLNAVKNVGEGAAQVIVEARQDQPGGRFGSLEAFVRAVDLRRVNKRALEALVKCGALDSLHANRAQLLAGLDALMAVGLHEQSARQEGQATLFSLLEEGAAGPEELRLELPPVPDGSARERLKLEKEALGFYVSGHPMDAYRSDVEQGTVFSNALRDSDIADGATVQVAGVVASLTLRMNKNAEKFAVLRLEDLRGSVEVVVFSRVYAEAADLLKLDEPLLIRGTANVQEEGVSVRADRVFSLSRHRAENARRVTVPVPAGLEEHSLALLVDVLSQAPGPCAVWLSVLTALGHRVLLDSGLAIQPTPEVVEELQSVLGGAELRFEYPPASPAPANGGRPRPYRPASDGPRAAPDAARSA